jgi:hypothetical protein
VIAMIVLEGVILVAVMMPSSMYSYHGVFGPWIITPLFTVDMQLAMILLIAVPAPGILIGIVYRSLLKKSGYTVVLNSKGDKGLAIIKEKWGAGVSIPIQSLSAEFDMKPSKVVKLITTWIKKGIRLKYNAIDNTVVLEA